MRRRPRSYIEWRTLRSWGALPPWELTPIGFVLRCSREVAGLTQAAVAERLGCSQQAVAQAERWESNPTVSFLSRWADAVGAQLLLELAPKVAGEVEQPRAKGVLAAKSLS